MGFEQPLEGPRTAQTAMRLGALADAWGGDRLEAKKANAEWVRSDLIYDYVVEVRRPCDAEGFTVILRAWRWSWA